MRKKISTQEIKFYLDSLLNMKIDIDNLPDELDDYKKDINDLLFHPGAKSGAECCGSGCLNCVQNINEYDFEKYNECLNNLIDKINSNI
jgi:hypothetical protein